MLRYLSFDILDLKLYLVQRLQRFNFIFKSINFNLGLVEVFQRTFELLRILKLREICVYLLSFHFKFLFLQIEKLDLVNQNLMLIQATLLK